MEGKGRYSMPADDPGYPSSNVERNLLAYLHTSYLHDHAKAHIWVDGKIARCRVMLARVIRLRDLGRIRLCHLHNRDRSLSSHAIVLPGMFGRGPGCRGGSRGREGRGWDPHHLAVMQDMRRRQ